MNKRYAVVLSEIKAHYNEQNEEILDGWDQTSRKLLLFDSEQQAEEALISYYMSQDCDYKVEVQKIGYVEVGTASEEPHKPGCECGKCTGEDRALEQMEKGICEAERNFGDN